MLLNIMNTVPPTSFPNWYLSCASGDIILMNLDIPGIQSVPQFDLSLANFSP